MSDNDFYIGYYPKASKKQGALLWKIVAGLLVLAGAVAVTLTMMQPDFPPSAFEFGVERDFEGIITEAPYPVLNIPRPDAETQMPGYSPYLLVVFGKSGAQQAVSGMDGKRVKLRGSLIYREEQTMIEIVDNSIELVSDAPATSLPALSRQGENLGTHELQGVMDRIDIITGTLGKALGGASGGYTSARREIVELLRQRSRPYLFSNSVAPPIVAASIKAIELLSASTDLRDKLEGNTQYFREEIGKVGLDIVPGKHPIVPVMLGDAELANRFANRMLEKGVYVIGFSFPVVPRGKARIRTQISAAHSRDDLAFAVEKFAETKAELGC